jgi:hypothetical protein
MTKWHPKNTKKMEVQDDKAQQNNCYYASKDRHTNKNKRDLMQVNKFLHKI